MEPAEYDADLALESLTERISEEAVDFFKAELSKGALLKLSPSVIRVREVIAEAERVRSVSPSATVLFSAVAVEITVKKLILEPLIAGLIHNQDAAPLITAALVGNHALYRARDLMVKLTKVAANYDLATHTRPGGSKPLLDETKELASQRDFILHRGEMASEASAIRSLVLADAMLNGVFAKLLRAFDLQMSQPTAASSTAASPTLVITDAPWQPPRPSAVSRP